MRGLRGIREEHKQKQQRYSNRSISNNSSSSSSNNSNNKASIELAKTEATAAAAEHQRLLTPLVNQQYLACVYPVHGHHLPHKDVVGGGEDAALNQTGDGAGDLKGQGKGVANLGAANVSTLSV